MSKTLVGEACTGSAALSAASDAIVRESFSRETAWRVEKYDGDAYAFVVDRRREADAIVDGRRGWSMGRQSAFRFLEHRAEIQAWAASEPKGLWTPGRVTDEALLRLFHEEVDPAGVVELAGNLLVTSGITDLLNLLTGAAATAFSNANAYLGVGDSSTAAAVGQTDLQAAVNKLRKAMNATYPVKSAPTIDFQSTFGSADANFVWNEVGTFNAAAAGTMLNRKVQALGTKSAGATWTLTETITWS